MCEQSGEMDDQHGEHKVSGFWLLMLRTRKCYNFAAHLNWLVSKSNKKVVAAVYVCLCVFRDDCILYNCLLVCKHTRAHMHMHTHTCTHAFTRHHEMHNYAHTNTHTET